MAPVLRVSSSDASKAAAQGLVAAQRAQDAAATAAESAVRHHAAKRKAATIDNGAPPAAPPAPRWQEAFHAAVPLDIACAILSGCSWEDRCRMALVNRHWGLQVFGSNDLWQFMAQRLEREHLVYAPPVCLRETWRQFFMTDLWPLRQRWCPSAPRSLECSTVKEYLQRTQQGEQGLSVEPAWKNAPKKYHFSISVVARFKAKTAAGPAAGAPQPAQVHLPLHQRVQLLKRQHNCTTEEAMQRVFGVTQGFFADALVREARAAEPADEAPAAEAPSPSAALAGAAAGVMSIAPGQVVMCAPGVGVREFRFNAVHGERATQAALYEDTGRWQVMEFINGLNCTILCYGQTGSGKTYTLFGPDAATSCSLNLTPRSGIVPRACAEVFAAVARRREAGIECALQMSYIEVFGEQVTDLLQQGTAVGAWQGTAARAVLEGYARVSVNTPQEVEELLLTGDGAKRRAATLMNERSSRAHALLFLTLTQQVGDVSSSSTLCFADLGGCEQLKKSGAQGQQLQEAININSGLLALKQCISALNEGSQHVPYQDSKLTLILSPSLGGDSKTTVVVTGSMDPQHSSETIQALRFGEKCAVVENEARNQASCIAGLIAALDADIAETRAQIRAKERWETRQVFKATDKDEDGVVTQEYVTQSALVGAEEEQARLDELLQRRRELLGEEEEEGAPADPPARDEASPGKGPAEALVLGPEPPKKRPRAPPARFLRAQEKQQEKADEAAARQAQRAERRAEAEQRRAALLNERKAKARQNSEMVLQVLQQKAAHAASGSSSGGLPPPPMRRVAYDEDLPMAAAQRAQVPYDDDVPMAAAQRAQESSDDGVPVAATTSEQALPMDVDE